MALKNIRAKASQTAEKVERMRRTQPTLDRVLVVYDAQSANIYYEGAPTPAPKARPN